MRISVEIDALRVEGLLGLTQRRKERSNARALGSYTARGGQCSIPR